MARVLRVSPNLPCVVQEGAMVMARGRHVGGSEARRLRTLLEACGQCEEVPEAQLDVHTGLSGSGVAFVSVVWSPHPNPRPHRPALPRPSGALRSPPTAPDPTAPRLGPQLPVCAAHPTSVPSRAFEASPLADPSALALALVAGAPDLVPEGPQPFAGWVLCPGECWLCPRPPLLQVCAFSEALADGAVKMGMPSGLAHRIAAQTLLVRPCCPVLGECVEGEGERERERERLKRRRG